MSATEMWLTVERWPMGDTEERQPMYCLYLKGPKVNAGLGWLRIGDVWDEEGANYLESLANAARQRDVAVQALEDFRVALVVVNDNHVLRWKGDYDSISDQELRQEVLRWLARITELGKEERGDRDIGLVKPAVSAVQVDWRQPPATSPFEDEYMSDTTKYLTKELRAEIAALEAALATERDKLAVAVELLRQAPGALEHGTIDTAIDWTADRDALLARIAELGKEG